MPAPVVVGVGCIVVVVGAIEVGCVVVVVGPVEVGCVVGVGFVVIGVGVVEVDTPGRVVVALVARAGALKVVDDAAALGEPPAEDTAA